MGTYEGQLKSIKTKLALLQFADEETANIIEKTQLSSLERQRKIVEKKVDEVHNLKVEIQEAKLQRGEKKTDGIKEWIGEIDAALSKFEHSLAEMKRIAKEVKRKQLEEEKRAELSFVHFSFLILSQGSLTMTGHVFLRSVFILVIWCSRVETE